MFRTSFFLALRHLRKYPLLGFLNLTGLALGTAASFILLLYVYQELTYDRHFRDADRIYRVATDFFNMGGFANSQEVLHQALKSEFGEVEAATRINPNYREMPVEINGERYSETGLYYIDSAFFKIFNYRLMTGERQPEPPAPDEVLLTEATARKYFGSEPAWGKTLRLGEERKEYTVAGIIEDSGARSHLEPSIFLAIPPDAEPGAKWTSASVYNYVKLRPAAEQADLERNLQRLLREVVYPSMGTEEPFETWVAGSKAVRFFVQPLTDIYLYSDYKFELSAGGNPQQVYILGLVGLFILFISAVNYINLSTARASVRAKEVGVKKTMGARRRTLIVQFLAESAAFGLLAMLLALGLMELLLAIFERLSGSVLTEGSFFGAPYLPAFLGFSLLAGLLSGIYPALYLTGFQPVKILRGEISVSGNKKLRGGLVVLQFAIAVALMSGSVVVYRQLQFMQNKDLGFEQEGILILENFGELGDRASAFREALDRHSEVLSSSVSGRVPAGSSMWMKTFKTPQMEQSQPLQTFPVDEDYIPTLDIELLAGRNFSEALDRDTMRLPAIVNEAAVRALGLGDDPLGAEINERQYVIGVVRNFNFESMRHRIAPVVLTYTPKGNRLVVRLQGRQMAYFIGALDQLWQDFDTGQPLRYYFLDQNFEQLAQNERTLSQAVAFFTLLAILIACLGLFGLAAFTAEQRTKEIGIRKVLGATTAAIVGLLSRDFLRYVLLAILLALPLSWWALQRWLDDYAYRVPLAWWMLALPATAAILIALFTVSYQSLRAANANPVEALRDE